MSVPEPTCCWLPGSARTMTGAACSMYMTQASGCGGVEQREADSRSSSTEGLKSLLPPAGIDTVGTWQGRRLTKRHWPARVGTPHGRRPRQGTCTPRSIYEDDHRAGPSGAQHRTARSVGLPPAQFTPCPMFALHSACAAGSGWSACLPCASRPAAYLPPRPRTHPDSSQNQLNTYKPLARSSSRASVYAETKRQVRCLSSLASHPCPRTHNSLALRGAGRLPQAKLPMP